MKAQLTRLKQSSGYNKNYNYSILCGLTGSAAAQFAKEGLQQDNRLYHFILNLEYGVWIALVLRTFFFICMVISNIKMLEFKVRSFAAIGSSMTVVTAFIANYVFNMLYEIILYFKFPTMNQYIGSVFCLAGVFVLKDQIVSDKEKKKNNENIETISVSSVTDIDKVISVNSIQGTEKHEINMNYGFKGKEDNTDVHKEDVFRQKKGIELKKKKSKSTADGDYEKGNQESPSKTDDDMDSVKKQELENGTVETLK